MTFLLASILMGCSGETAPSADHADHADHDKSDADKGHDKSADKGHGDHHGDHGGGMEMKKPAEGAKVLFVEPADGAKLKSPVKIKMGVEGMEVKPAGELVDGTGHHHIIVDSDPVAFGAGVPKDDKHIHFGKGQTEAELELAAGEHKLQLQFADGAHRSYGEQMTATITVTVE